MKYLILYFHHVQTDTVIPKVFESGFSYEKSEAVDQLWTPSYNLGTHNASRTCTTNFHLNSHRHKIQNTYMFSQYQIILYKLNIYNCTIVEPGQADIYKQYLPLSPAVEVPSSNCQKKTKTVNQEIHFNRQMKEIDKHCWWSSQRWDITMHLFAHVYKNMILLKEYLICNVITTTGKESQWQCNHSSSPVDYQHNIY